MAFFKRPYFVMLASLQSPINCKHIYTWRNISRNKVIVCIFKRTTKFCDRLPVREKFFTSNCVAILEENPVCGMSTSGSHISKS